MGIWEGSMAAGVSGRIDLSGRMFYVFKAEQGDHGEERGVER